MGGEPGIQFVIGEERNLRDIISDSEMIPLLKAAVKAGAGEASIVSAGFDTLRQTGERVDSPFTAEAPLYLEGEQVATVVVVGEEKNERLIRGIASLLGENINSIVSNNLKRMLTTELHTTVVNQSYEELLATNRRLADSEARYRELAEGLEIKVQERTAELKRAQMHLLQQEKMAAIGQLAAGVAHEINTPMGFITSNLNTLNKYVARFVTMLGVMRELSPEQGKTKAIDDKWAELRIDAITKDAGALLTESLAGAERVTRIVADLKGFSHVDDSVERPVDLNQELERTLSVMSHQLPRDAEISKAFSPLPATLCNPALICQLFFNVILNAIQAKPDGLKLILGTHSSGETIRIEIADNGPGIPDEIRKRLFEPFFSTRDVGEGAGLGLTVAYNIMQQYGGSIEAAPREEGGTVIILTMPIRGNSNV